MTAREIEKKLLSYGIEDAGGETCLILERLFGLNRANLMADRERDFSSSELDGILEKRKDRIPLQYIFGDWEFMGKRFLVSPECLIPQPDTEILVEKALDIIKERKSQGEREQNGESALSVADLCTGSGCIGLSLLMYGDVEAVMMMDLSEGALKMAKKNAELHGLSDRCHFMLGDIRTELPWEKFDLIVSNPPYIPSRDIESLSDEVKKEPRLALDGGEDGLDLIRFLIGDGLKYLKKNGAMLIEFGYDQGKIMDTLLRQKRDTGSIKSYEILKDYGGNDRVAVIWAN